jgi:hypothetical protein
VSSRAVVVGLVVFVVVAGCGGKNGLVSDARPADGAPSEVGTDGGDGASPATPEVGPDVAPGEHPDVAPEVRPDVAPETGGAPDARVDVVDAPAAPTYPCNLDCPGGPCARRAGHPPEVVVSNTRKDNVIASLAVGGGSVFYGTISHDLNFELGHLVKVSLSTGAATELDARVQASQLVLDGDRLFYVGDAIQSSAVTLYGLPPAGGERQALVSSDTPFHGLAVGAAPTGERLWFYGTGMAPYAIIWSAFGDEGAYGFSRIADVAETPHGFALDGPMIYDASGDGRSRIRLRRWYDSDDQIKEVATAPDHPLGLPVVAGNELLFVHQPALPAGAGRCVGSVAAVPKNGGAQRTVSLGRSGSDVSSLATDGTYVYWSTFDDGGTVFRAPRAGGAPEIIAAEQREARALALDGARVYWIVTSETGGQVRAVAK